MGWIKAVVKGAVKAPFEIVGGVYEGLEEVAMGSSDAHFGTIYQDPKEKRGKRKKR